MCRLPRRPVALVQFKRFGLRPYTVRLQIFQVSQEYVFHAAISSCRPRYQRRQGEIRSHSIFSALKLLNTGSTGSRYAACLRRCRALSESLRVHHAHVEELRDPRESTQSPRFYRQHRRRPADLLHHPVLYHSQVRCFTESRECDRSPASVLHTRIP